MVSTPEVFSGTVLEGKVEVKLGKAKLSILTDLDPDQVQKRYLKTRPTFIISYTDLDEKDPRASGYFFV